MATNLEEFIEKLSYKPGTHFYCLEEKGIISIFIDIPTVDSESGETVYLRAKEKYDKKYFWVNPLDHIREIIHSAEIHEADEWFTYENNQIFNPHE